MSCQRRRPPWRPWNALNDNSTRPASRGANNATCCPYPDGLQGALLCSRTFTPLRGALLALRAPRQQAAVAPLRRVPTANRHDRDLADVALARDRQLDVRPRLQRALELRQVRRVAALDGLLANRAGALAAGQCRRRALRRLDRERRDACAGRGVLADDPDHRLGLDPL